MKLLSEICWSNYRKTKGEMVEAVQVAVHGYRLETSKRVFAFSRQQVAQFGKWLQSSLQDAMHKGNGNAIIGKGNTLILSALQAI